MAPSGAAFPFVVEGSCLLSRMTCLVLIAVARGVAWACENPDRSALTVMPATQHLTSPRLSPLFVRWFLGLHVIFELVFDVHSGL